MELSDEQLVLMTWDVAVRKGWGFVVDTLLRGGVDVFSPASGVCKDQGFRGQFGDWSQQGLIPEDNPMVSQESGDEEDEITVMDKSCLNSNEWPSWTGQCPRCSATTLSSREESPVLSTKGKYQGGTSVHSKIKEFIVEVTSVFHNYFSGLEMPGSKPTLPSCEPSDPALIYGQPGLSTGMLVQRPSKDAQAQAPSWDASSVPVGPLPTDAISRPSPLPQQVLPSVAVTGSVLPAPAGVADDFHWVKPLAAHVPRKLRETVRKQQLDDEAAMKKKPRQHQEPELGMGDLVKFGTICSKCGGKHPSAECTIVKPCAESLIQENQKNPNGGPETKDYCTFYNKGECSVGEICRYKHVCSGCGDNHPWVKCSKLNPMSLPLKRRASRRGKRRANKKTPICQKYNIEKCKFGNICVFKHVCSECYRPHPVVKCGRVNYLN